MARKPKAPNPETSVNDPDLDQTNPPDEPDTESGDGLDESVGAQAGHYARQNAKKARETEQ